MLKMFPTKSYARLGLVIALLGSLSACTISPSYPAYGYAYREAPRATAYYYPSNDRGYYRNDNHQYHDYERPQARQEPRYVAPPRVPSPFESAAKVHRDIRRSLGLPRLPGMP